MTAPAAFSCLVPPIKPTTRRPIPDDASEDEVRKYGDSNDDEHYHGIAFQQCGGGRRILRKRIGSN